MNEEPKYKKADLVEEMTERLAEIFIKQIEDEEMNKINKNKKT